MLTKHLVSKGSVLRREFATTATSLQQIDKSQQGQPAKQAENQLKEENLDIAKVKQKSTLQSDEELRKKMAGISGDGGEAGIEYEDGQPVSMKRSVKNNMFRYI